MAKRDVVAGQGQAAAFHKINSAEEGDALATMMPEFSGCLDKGQEFQTSRLILCGIVACNYYRLAYAPRVRGPIVLERQ